ncbi:phosphatidylglycerol phospholipase [Ascoidea rubescens DSM 1968]|uniref:PLC-like phosphodiesterase n=1 Tax=Ascoidea rubescens DSM 1968 TaxID=1344418 RepID=A0A1D2VQ93_9ASCO|nr:PLC-like phosphodiesterase [Ascoidea rubescens DSM 1968]ODV63766.1 PLC-like phosphodiesterase [Ascoidea rubescens DSM 1968]
MSSKPLCIGHRGFRRLFPENTLLSFTQARNAGCDIIETDVQLSKDEVVVICHDSKTGRVFSDDLNIYESTLEQLQTIRTNKEPHESMPTFKQLIAWFLKPENSKLKIMLDVKRSNNLKILDIILSDLLSFNPDREFWVPKIQFGLWDLNFYSYAIQNDLLKGFEIINISFSPKVSLKLLELSDKQDDGLKIKGVSLLHLSTWDNNLFSKNLKNDSFMKNFLIEQCDKKKLDLYFWTVNAKQDLICAINFPYVKGVITDNPDHLKELLDNYTDITIINTKDSKDSEESGESGKSGDSENEYLNLKLSQLQRLYPSNFSNLGIKRFIFYKWYNLTELCYLNNWMGLRLSKKLTVGVIFISVFKIFNIF